MHEKYSDIVIDKPEIMRAFAAENRMPMGTQIVLLRDLPEEDENGNPIFAFSVSAGEYHYWTGAPIKWELPSP